MNRQKREQLKKETGEAQKERITNRTGEIDDGTTSPAPIDSKRRGAMEGTREDSPTPPQTTPP